MLGLKLTGHDSRRARPRQLPLGPSLPCQTVLVGEWSALERVQARRSV